MITEITITNKFNIEEFFFYLDLKVLCLKIKTPQCLCGAKSYSPNYRYKSYIKLNLTVTKAWMVNIFQFTSCSTFVNPYPKESCGVIYIPLLVGIS